MWFVLVIVGGFAAAVAVDCYRNGGKLGIT
jgi:hypothetical protein